MLLSIITINRNNAVNLEKTILSVLKQNLFDFEYIIIDGASDDGSVDVIRRFSHGNGVQIKWISEADTGIYNAMNKGLSMASGEYVQFLNSGDCLVSEVVVQTMYKALEINNYPPILYGNMLKEMQGGSILRDKCFAGQEISFLGFYFGTLNHSPAYIKRVLFEKYGLYDESYKIVSDWKWYLQAIIFGGEKPVYTDFDVTLFDMNGISETNKDLDKKERDQVLNELVNPAFLADYNRWSFSILQIKRLKRHPWAYRLMWFIDRCLFKVEQFHNKKSLETQFM